MTNTNQKIKAMTKVLAQNTGSKFAMYIINKAGRRIDRVKPRVFLSLPFIFFTITLLNDKIK